MAKREVDLEDEENERNNDKSVEMREALTRALREEELRELKYKCERKACEMGILFYEADESPEERLQRLREEEEKKNQDYPRKLPERAERMDDSDSDDGMEGKLMVRSNAT